MSLDVMSRDEDVQEVPVQELLSQVLVHDGSDLHLTAGAHPTVRIHGDLQPLTHRHGLKLRPYRQSCIIRPRRAAQGAAKELRIGIQQERHMGRGPDIVPFRVPGYPQVWQRIRHQQDRNA